MKNRNPLVLPLIAAIFTALPAHATLPENFVTVNAKITYQKDQVFLENGGTERVRGILGTMRINTKELLAIIADQLGIDLPRRARFLHMSSGLSASVERGGVPGDGMWIVDAEGNLIANVSEFFNMQFNLGGLIYSGVFNLTTGAERTLNRFPFDIQFNIPGEGGAMSKTRGEEGDQGVFLEGNGVMREKFSAGVRRSVLRARARGLGNGYVTGFVGENFPRGIFGGNATGFFNVRINGTEVIEANGTIEE